MSIILKPLTSDLSHKIISRAFGCSCVLPTKEWRVKSGLPVNKNAEGPLTDKPDYTFLDGRPTPILHKQKMRLLKQRGFAERIIELSAELDFAINREQELNRMKEEERQNIIRNRLKPKGLELFKKH